MPLHEEVFYPQIVNPNILRAESAEVPWRILGFTSAEEKMFNLQYTTSLISKVA
jgi:hypothetical protein